MGTLPCSLEPWPGRRLSWAAERARGGQQGAHSRSRAVRRCSRSSRAAPPAPPLPSSSLRARGRHPQPLPPTPATNARQHAACGAASHAQACRMPGAATATNAEQHAACGRGGPCAGVQAGWRCQARRAGGEGGPHDSRARLSRSTSRCRLWQRRVSHLTTSAWCSTTAAAPRLRPGSACPQRALFNRCKIEDQAAEGRW